MAVYSGMRPIRPFFRYRRDLKTRARTLRRDFEKFTRQKALGAYIADFYCARHRLIIELDGDSHFTDAGERHDHSRTHVLGHYGINVIRFTNVEVLQQFEAVCARIEEALANSPQP
jgi:very-short-patch-repair endonuclease